ncbi:MAG: c-type cytochrome [Burkholderiales bacterium]
MKKIPWRGARSAVAAMIVPAALVCIPPAKAADIFKGREAYESHCQSCHGDDGRGRVANAPDFTRGQGLMAPDIALLRSIQTGKGAMPAFRGLVRDRDMLDVVAFLRTFQR